MVAIKRKNRGKSVREKKGGMVLLVIEKKREKEEKRGKGFYKWRGERGEVRGER